MQDKTPVLPEGFTVPDTSTGNPAAILDETLSGLRRFHVLAAACRLGIFSHCTVPLTADELSGSLGLRPTLAELFLESLVAQELLVKNDGKFQNSTFSERYLNPSSPYCQQDLITLQMHLSGLWNGLEDILKAGPRSYKPEDWFSGLVIPAMAANARCGILQETVKIVTSQPEFQAARTLLDMGGGHGLYTMAFCQANPELNGVIFDLHGVIPATRRYIDYYHADRVTCNCGNFFTDPLGSGFDIIFSSSNPGGKAPSLIPKIRDALKPGGLFINKQGNDKVLDNPLMNLEWNLWTVEGMTKDQRQYSFSYSIPFEEYNQRLGEQGFLVREVVSLDEQSIMTIAKKGNP